MVTQDNDSVCPKRLEEVTVLVDTREQYPVRFPQNIRIPDPGSGYKGRLIKVFTERKKLDAGDYCLKGYEGCCVIERKASPMELYKNLFDRKDKARQGRALTKMVNAVEFPYLMVETSPQNILGSQLPGDIDPEVLVGKIMGMVARYGLRLLWLPWRGSASGRTSMGLVLVHLMVGHVLNKYYNEKPELI